MLVSEPRLTWLEDPEVFAVNRKEAHSDHVYYENTEEMVLGADMPLRQSLNGTWYFSYAKNPTVRVKDFYKTLIAECLIRLKYRDIFRRKDMTDVNISTRCIHGMEQSICVRRWYRKNITRWEVM